MKQNKQSIIVRLPNWVGDAIMALPALKALQELGIEVYICGKPWLHDLFAATNLHIYSLDKSFAKSVKILKSIPSNYIILFTNSFSSALMTRCAFKKPIGYDLDARRYLLHKHLKKERTQHEVQHFWDLAHFACKHLYKELQWPPTLPSHITLPLHPNAIAKVRDIRHKFNITSPFYLICPFAHGQGANGQSKIWPHWQEFSYKLQERGIQIVVCPGPNEKHLCAHLAPSTIIVPELNLSEYAALMAEASQVIANDSGPMHIAACVGVTMLGLFGTSSPTRTRPWGGNFAGENGQWPSLEQVLALTTTS